MCGNVLFSLRRQYGKILISEARTGIHTTLPLHLQLETISAFSVKHFHKPQHLTSGFMLVLPTSITVTHQRVCMPLHTAQQADENSSSSRLKNRCSNWEQDLFLSSIKNISNSHTCYYFLQSYVSFIQNTKVTKSKEDKKKKERKREIIINKEMTKQTVCRNLS
jgi:hypothetical protein